MILDKKSEYRLWYAIEHRHHTVFKKLFSQKFTNEYKLNILSEFYIITIELNEIDKKHTTMLIILFESNSFVNYFYNKKHLYKNNNLLMERCNEIIKERTINYKVSCF